jgi:opacity protein-like surface antigen
MRHLLLVVVVLSALTAQVYADVARTTIGDVPRTYTDFLNAPEAALCRANAATGGVGEYFFNPAVIAGTKGIAGQATIRFNAKSRDYLPDSDTEYLNVGSDDVVLFSQAVAVRNAGGFAFGFGYSTPAYRSLSLDGRLARPADSQPASYEGKFGGSIRCFEVLGAARLGPDQRAAVGVAAGIATFEESAREVAGNPRTLGNASLDGKAASVAIGAEYEATDMLTLGAGYRFGTSFDVSGELKVPEVVEGDPNKSGTDKTEAVAVLGVRFRPIENYTFSASYINEGWEEAEATFAAYYPTPGGCEDCEESLSKRDAFSKSLQTFAVGAEGAFIDGRLILRAGYSKSNSGSFNNEGDPEYRELVPQYAVGLGGTWMFETYSVDVAVVHQAYADGDESAQVVNNGFYLSVGYAFE